MINVTKAINDCMYLISKHGVISTGEKYHYFECNGKKYPLEIYFEKYPPRVAINNLILKSKSKRNLLV
jgi:hypothetical protein